MTPEYAQKYLKKEDYVFVNKVYYNNQYASWFLYMNRALGQVAVVDRRNYDKRTKGRKIVSAQLRFMNDSLYPPLSQYLKFPIESIEFYSSNAQFGDKILVYSNGIWKESSFKLFNYKEQKVVTTQNEEYSTFVYKEGNEHLLMR